MALVGVFFGAKVAGDVQLDAVSDDITWNLVAQGPHQAFDGGSAELPHVAAHNADGVVVVLHPGKGVPGCTIGQVQAADDADFQQKFEGPENGCPSHRWQLSTDLLGSEAAPLFFEDMNDTASGIGGAVSSVFEDCHDVRPDNLLGGHGTLYH